MCDSQDTGDAEGWCGDPTRIYRGHLSISPRLTYELLSNRYRRYVLHFFATRSTEVSNRRELATVISEWTADLDGSSTVSPEQVEIKLHHVHLPKLADANMLDYDERTGFVRYWGEPTVEKFTARAVAAGEPRLPAADQ